MKSLHHASLGLLLFGLMGGQQVLAATPTCVGNETKLSWPATNPVWEMCWLRPGQSVGPDGSGLEVRDVHYNGIPVMRRMHAPLLFAEYRGSGTGGICYRDWKNDDANTLAVPAVRNTLGTPPFGSFAKTSCDRSDQPTASFGTCPYGLSMPGASCGSGVMIEDLGDEVRLTTQYAAAWYMYTSRFAFFKDGRIQPFFGFGNTDGTNNGITHWHHNYWRFEFNIDGDGDQMMSENGVDKTTEFSALRNLTGGVNGGPTTWEVRNATSGRGYRLVPGSGDYVVPTNQSGRGLHTVDVMGTKQIDGEYGDRTDNDLGACQMNQGALVNGQAIDHTTVALYYRVAVRDSTANNWPPGCTSGNCVAQDSMVCKNTGPMLVPFGDWSDYIHVSGLEGPINGATP
jgi:hypothetical protein